MLSCFLTEETATTRPEIVPQGSKPGSMRLTNPIVQKAPSFSETRKDASEASNIKPANAMAPEIAKKRNEMPYSSDKDQKAAAWEKEKLADVKKRYHLFIFICTVLVECFFHSTAKNFQV